MLRKFIKWLVVVFAGLLVLVVLGTIALMLLVNKQMVIGKLESLLHRHITVADVSTGIFSPVSGLKAKEVRISNFKSAPQLKNLQGQAVTEKDLFLEIKTLSIKIKLLPLLSKRIELKELALQQANLHLILYKNGLMNISDLLTSETESKPLTADDLPLGLSLEKIAFSGGTIDYENRRTQQTTRLYDFTLLVPTVEIDPARLAEKNSLALSIRSGLKSLGLLTAGGFKSFDLRPDRPGQNQTLFSPDPQPGSGNQRHG